MDRVRFDALTRALVAGGSRRGVLGAILGGALLGAGFEADAKNKHKHKNKNKNKQQAQPAGDLLRHAGVRVPQRRPELPRLRPVEDRHPDLRRLRFPQRRSRPRRTCPRGASRASASARRTCAGRSWTSPTSAAPASATPAWSAPISSARTSTARTSAAPSSAARSTPTADIDDSGCGDTDDCCPPCLGFGDACGEGIFGECCNSDCINGTCQTECFKDTDCRRRATSAATISASDGDCCDDFDCGNGRQCLRRPSLPVRPAPRLRLPDPDLLPGNGHRRLPLRRHAGGQRELRHMQ